ncbi:hypothetical protein C7S20_05235 [Christiangramia fulva]|uniref:HTH araC/xylS-type domain-containing protein n=1 Tax=Christiangramia fulva TaxID=2126553 RepID=A0A2R3Z378_9FLAO|nr:hypothetical protein [Christiangramia fulva]AVR44715.1 hypothetical protein C7S20_05235 [Christiangramia fulva]
MADYTANHLLLDDHPLFFNVSIMDYKNEIKNHDLTGSGKIYLCFLYGGFSKINSDGFQPELPKVNIQPVENHFSMSVDPGARLITMGIKRPQYWYNITKLKLSKKSKPHYNFYRAVPPDILDPLYKDFEEMESPKKILRRMDNTLKDFYGEWGNKTPIDELINEILERHGRISIKEILEKYPIARSTLNAYFDKYIGIAPKFYIRLIQFNYILREHFIYKKCLADIIRDWEFYDYSHFKKDMMLFTGVSPTNVEEFQNDSIKGYFNIDSLFKKINYG